MPIQEYSPISALDISTLACGLDEVPQHFVAKRLWCLISSGKSVKLRYLKDETNRIWGPTYEVENQINSQEER